jgi:hypothetical protein
MFRSGAAHFLVLAVVTTMACEEQPSAICRVAICGFADAPPDVLQPLCNPITNVGCASADRCTWLEVDPQLGVIGCVPLVDEPVGLGEPCVPMVTQGVRHDNCGRGLYCVASLCELVCDLVMPACEAPSTCISHPGVFVEQTEILFGTCQT